MWTIAIRIAKRQYSSWRRVFDVVLSGGCPAQMLVIRCNNTKLLFPRPLHISLVDRR